MGIEAGCISFWIIEELKKFSLPAICIESRQMAMIIALKVNKTDRNDARLIADAMRCNLYKEVFHKTKECIEIGVQMGVRRILINTRTKLKNGVRGFLKAYGIRLGAISHQKFSKAVRESLQGSGEGVIEAIESLLKSYEEVARNIEKVGQGLERLSKSDPIIGLFESIPGVGAITA